MYRLLIVVLCLVFVTSQAVQNSFEQNEDETAKMQDSDSKMDNDHDDDGNEINNNSEWCYNLKDKGLSYAGTRSYTNTSTPCVPWKDLTKCPYNPYSSVGVLANLKDNFCRNPDGSEKPWCHVDAATCKKEFCDVCNPECPSGYKVFNRKCYMTVTVDVPPDQREAYCIERKGKYIKSNSLQGAILLAKILNRRPKGDLAKYVRKNCEATGAVKDCMFLCESKLGAVTPLKTCPKPSAIDSAALERYNVGDKVRYSCVPNSNLTTEMMCLSDGSWIVTQTDCHECPSGYSVFNKKCYMAVTVYLPPDQRKAYCIERKGKYIKSNSLQGATLLAQIISWRPKGDLAKYVRKNCEATGAVKDCMFLCESKLGVDNVCDDSVETCSSLFDEGRLCDTHPTLKNLCSHTCRK